MIEHKNYNCQLDLLRFLTAIGVMVAHYINYTPYNIFNINYTREYNSLFQLGVHVFFIISGYVIVGSAEGVRPKAFIIKRAIRLYPAVLICITICFIFVSLSGRYGLNVPNYVYVGNFYEWLVNISLLNKFVFDAEFIDGVMWTIVIEIKFYIMIFILLFFVSKLEKPIFVYGVLSMIFMVVKDFQVTVLMRWAPFFSFGAMVFFVKRDGLNASRLVFIFFCLVFMVLQVSKLFFEPRFEAAIAMFFLSVIFLLFTFVDFIRLDRNISLFLGGLSYPLYLIHNNIGAIVIKNDVLSTELLMVVMLLFSGIVFFVENKVRRKLYSYAGKYL